MAMGALVAIVMSTALTACGSNSFSFGRSSSTTSSAPSVHNSGSTTTQPLPSTNPLTTPTSLPKPAPIVWTTCSSLAAEAVTSVGRFQCGTLKVPISYSDPGAGSLTLALVRLPASGPGPVLGDIVTNPGGPGGSGVDFLEQNANGFPASLRSKFNLVSFDPRGVARSDPVTCVSPTQIRQLLSLNPAPVGTTQIDQVVAATKQFDAACAAHTSRLMLENMSTVDVAIDMDEIRAALGQAKLTYLGFSYGTYLGAVYAQLFPTHVRAMVLDGALNPDLTNNELSLQQAESFEVDLNDFFNWCDANSTCESELPGGAAGDYQRLMSGLEDGATLPSELIASFGGDQTVDYGVAVTGVLASLYSQSDWPELGQALQQAIGGDGSDLDAIALSYAGFQPNGSLENIEESNTAVNCLDHPAPTTVSEYVSLAQQFAAKAPDFGALEAWGSLSCAYWPVPPTGNPAPIHAPGAPPILVVGTTHDPATPYAWAQALASQLDKGVLLTRDGDGHTAYFSSTCIQNWADSYLTTLATPPRGTVCQSN
jgi:pimeloyl-ACP methyl ester carboxylesterase